MKKQYTQDKFKALPTVRKAQILLQALRETENRWEESSNKPLTLARNYLEWLKDSECELKRFAHLSLSLENNPELRKLYNIIVPLERFLEEPCKDQDFIPVAKVDSLVRSQEKLPIYVILDHLRSAFNVGSIFRTCEGLGVSHIYLVGYTPTPNDLRVQKTSMGTCDAVPWSHTETFLDIITTLKKKNISCLALETSPLAKSIYEISAPQPVALILGNERFGLSQESLKNADYLVNIPMRGRKNSLNVATALGLTAFEIARQWKQIEK